MKFRLLAPMLLAFGVSAPAHAISNNTWDDISTYTELSLLGVALAAPIVHDDWEGEGQAALSIGTAIGIATLGKAVIHEQRPDNSNNNSFPSGHTSIAFSSATTLYRRYGWQIGFPAYAVAALTGTARVAARKHHWYDVVAGAAIGTGTGWFFTDAFNDKVQLTPWVDSTGGGVMVAVRW
ncbi:MAG: phosphatase PAP2 family protein [Xanthomonadaceae bacterium]|nr:phosphatase PAP2 family protein [Xanthomonadaceae bacterium]